MNLDQFFTNENIAKECFQIFNEIIHKNYEVYLEPSAGSGSFFNLSDKFVGFDISPMCENVIKADFLTIDLSSYLNKKQKIVSIGNPPFGKRGKTALQFLNKCLKHSEFVGFILPLQFCKWSLQSKIDPKAKLIFEKTLPDKSFHTPDNKLFKIRCVFQIWTLKDIEEIKSLPFFKQKNNINLRIKDKPQLSHSDFEIYQYNRTQSALKFFDYDWDFAIYRQGFLNYNEKFFKKEECNPKQQYMFFKAKNKQALSNLLSIDFEKLSLKNSSIPGLGKNDVIEEYKKLFEKNK